MTEYALYLESGPRRRTTMVHVLDLPGCIAQGPTTEEALEATPDAIRAYLRFLRRHGEAVEPELAAGRGPGAFTTVVAEHVMEGPWLGYGNPAPGFGPDFNPLATEELNTHLRRLAWLWEDLLQLVHNVPPEQLAAEPEGGGRSIYRILEHVAAAQKEYVRSALGKVDGLSEALREIQQGSEALPAALTDLWEITNARLEAMTEEERRQLVQRGQVTWTARRALRRMLEHGWEHVQELSRLYPPIPADSSGLR